MRGLQLFLQGVISDEFQETRDQDGIFEVSFLN